LARKSDLRTVIIAIETLPLWAPLAVLGIIYASIPLRALQWKMLIGNSSAVQLRSLFHSLLLGYLGSAVAPTGGGEIIKAYALARAANVPFARVLASVFLVRIQDLPPVMMFAIAALNIFTTNGASEHMTLLEATQVSLIFLAGIAILASVGMFVARDSFGCLPALLDRARAAPPPAFSQTLRQMLERFGQGLETAGQARLFWGGQACAALCWTLFAIAPFPLLACYGIAPRQALLTSVTITGIVTLFHLIPVTPGGIGTYHVACVWVMTSMNPTISRDAAVAYSVVPSARYVRSGAPRLIVATMGHWSEAGVNRRRPTFVKIGSRDRRVVQDRPKGCADTIPSEGLVMKC